MEANEYMNLAMRTNDGKWKERLMRSLAYDRINIAEALDASLGLSGETGELNEMLKKAVFHGHEIDREEVKKEIGDILWYATLMCYAFRFELDDVMNANIEKLQKRYPEGFSEYASQHRGVEEGGKK